MSLPTARKRTPRLASATARSALAIGAHDLAGLARGRDDAVELAVDLRGMRIDVGAVGQRDREVGRPEEQRVDPRRGAIASRLSSAVRVSIIAKVTVSRWPGAGSAFWSGMSASVARGAAPAALAERREFRERRVGARILRRC